MTTASKQAVRAFITAIAAVLCTQMSSAAGMADPEPIIVWDGAKTAYNFSTLTKKIDNNTYTLNLNEMNSVAADGSYVQIGSENAKAAITITAVNDDTSITNAFGTDGTVTVIMKYTDLPVSAGSNRALISLLDNQKYKGGNVGSDNSVKIGVSDFTGTGYFCWQGGYYSSFAGANFAATEQTAALTYSSTDGTAFYLDGVGISTNTGLKAAGYTTPCGIALGGVDTDDSNQFFAMTGMKIKAVAIFTSTLTAEQIANYKFPSESPISVSLVSEINDIFGQEDEIDVILADGATITGDTTFNASTVRFHCNGSFSLQPPANNVAVFDFSDVTGQPIIVYDAVLPTVTGSTFTSNTVPTFVTDPTLWSGTIWLVNQTITNFDPTLYGNAASTLRLSGIYAYFKNQTTPLQVNSSIELVNGSYNYGLNVYNGFSRDGNAPGRYIVINKLKGDGELWTSDSAGNVLMNVLDWSEFSGKIQIVNKIVVFGSYVPPVAEFNTSGAIYIGTNVTVALPAAKQWRASNGIHVFGTFKATGIGDNQINSDTSVITYDSGTFVLMTNSNTDDLDVNYSRIKGTGTLRYEGTGYRTISRSNFPTTMTVENNLSNNGLIHRVPNAELSIGSLAGNGRMRSDWGGSESIGDRDLRILQSKDTTYDGLFDAALDRINNVIVASGASSTGTLTITGMQTANNNLVVESGAAVNLTGTWVGATTVAGTIGGTGTLTGNLTLTDGATIKGNDISDPLEVSGSLTATGAITIELPEGAGKGMVISTGSKPDITGATFTTKVGGVERKLKVTATANGLKVGAQSLLIRIR